MRPLPTLLALVLAVGPCATPPDAPGRWTGYLFPPFDAIPVALDVTLTEGGTLTGTFLAPTVGYPAVPLGDVHLAGDTLVAALADPLSWVAFEGRLDGDRYEGEFHEGGGSTPFVLARAGTAAARALDARAAAQRATPPDPPSP